MSSGMEPMSKVQMPVIIKFAINALKMGAILGKMVGLCRECLDMI